jgi:hypothetical protein
MREDGTRFAGRQHHGQLGRARDALDVVDEVELLIEHLLVEKEQRGKSLILRRSGNLLIDGQMSEKLSDFAFAHLLRMAFAMEKDVAPNPIDVSLLGSYRVVFYAQMPPNAVE